MTEENARTTQRIADDLAAVGIRPGGLLLVHSSLSSMGRVPGGPGTVVAGLRRALGPEGTLLLPALTYEYVNADQPLFEQAHTPSCVGAISEHFRTSPGVQRSLAPTHSVCGAGPLAGEVLGRRHLDRTPCGENSPFRAVRDLEGAILFLGCGMRPNTSMHGVEELSQPPYLFAGEIQYEVVGGDGTRLHPVIRRHAFKGWTQRYDRLEGVLQDRGLRQGKVLEATVHLVDAPVMWDRADAALRRDPHFFVERQIG